MLKETVTYTDYDGKERTEDLYFNLEKHELIDLAFDLPDDIIVADEETGEIKENHMVEKLGDKGIYKFIKDVIKKAYGGLRKLIFNCIDCRFCLHRCRICLCRCKGYVTVIYVGNIIAAC